MPRAADGLALSGDLRLRGESLADSYRPIAPGTDRVLATRLRVRAVYGGERISAAVELQDSRLFGDEARSPVGTDDVNALEPLQAWLGWRPQPGWELRLGRQTVDYGSRRLLARNRYRNTANSFTGARLTRSLAGEALLQAFIFYPDERRPDARDRRALRANEARLDPIAELGRFSGVAASGLVIAATLEADAYLLRRVVDDSPLGIRDRSLTTAGGRLVWSRAAWRGELEAALQFGESRASLTPAAAMVDHRAWFLHAGLTRELAPGPELRLEFDIASGDDDPGDGRVERFDKLYGARASELGPTGIWGLIDRSNLLSPAASLRFGDDRRALTLGYRTSWLESDRDFLPSAGLRDPAGESGDFLGHQWSSQVTLRPGPALTLEAGAVYLAKGEFLQDAPAAAASGDSRYLWLSAAYRF
jgi:hypothetical protein